MSAAAPAFTRAQLEAAPRSVLRAGRWANAVVLKVRIGAQDWTVKDFGSRAWWVRNGLARWLLRRELRALQRLADLDGVPRAAFRVDAHAIAAHFVPGRTLDKAPAAQMTPEFFVALEALFQQIHARGLVHLDSRGSSNLLATPDGRPAVIDFQAAVDTRRLPRALRMRLEAIDLSGVYKNWQRRAPDTMDAARAAAYAQSTRWRRLWPARGYFGISKDRHK